MKNSLKNKEEKENNGYKKILLLTDVSHGEIIFGGNLIL
jgi:hypothetical protein